MKTICTVLKINIKPSLIILFLLVVHLTSCSKDDGPTKEEIMLLSQKQILQAILDTNPENTLNWDLNTITELGVLDEVTLNSENEIIELRIIHGNISTLPPGIGQLTNLTSLDLTDNQLTSLPPEIEQLTNLTELILIANKLRSLPTEIGLMTNLTLLNFKSNPPFKMLSVICDLQTSNGGILTILSDTGEECN